MIQKGVILAMKVMNFCHSGAVSWWGEEVIMVMKDMGLPEEVW